MRLGYGYIGPKRVANAIAAAANIVSRVERAMVSEMRIELREVNKRTPKDRGYLEESNRIEGPERSGRSIRVYIRSGDERAWYALYVHEDLEAFHAIGQAKYLESVLFESAPYIMARIAARARLGGSDGAA